MSTNQWLYVFSIHLRPAKGCDVQSEAPIVCVFTHPPTDDDIVSAIVATKAFQSGSAIMAMTRELTNLPKPDIIERMLELGQNKIGWPSISVLSLDHKAVMSLSRCPINGNGQ